MREGVRNTTVWKKGKGEADLTPSNPASHHSPSAHAWVKRREVAGSFSKWAWELLHGEFWAGILFKSGQIEARRAWRRVEVFELRELEGVEDAFGPFEAPSYNKALLELRKMMVAIGFRVPQ